MSLSNLQLTSSSSLVAPVLTRTQTGLSPIQAPQSFNASYEYTLGSSDITEVDGPIYKAVVLNGGSATTINLVTGTESDPTGDSPLRIATLKEVLIAVAGTNPDDSTETPADGVTVDFNADMMHAMGWATGAATKTLLRFQRMAESNPTGLSTNVNASITITNLSATGKTTVMLAFAGFRVP